MSDVQALLVNGVRGIVNLPSSWTHGPLARAEDAGTLSARENDLQARLPTRDIGW